MNGKMKGLVNKYHREEDDDDIPLTTTVYYAGHILKLYLFLFSISAFFTLSCYRVEKTWPFNFNVS